MSIEVRPVGVTCNLRCKYCYEAPMREEQAVHRYNPEAVKAAIAKLGPHDFFSLFGGEALLIPLPQVEELLKLSFDKHGQSGIQTNGSLITEKHIEVFHK